jgi:hypothetical protein
MPLALFCALWCGALLPCKWYWLLYCPGMFYVKEVYHSLLWVSQEGWGWVYCWSNISFHCQQHQVHSKQQVGSNQNVQWYWDRAWVAVGKCGVCSLYGCFGMGVGCTKVKLKLVPRICLIQFVGYQEWYIHPNKWEVRWLAWPKYWSAWVE